MASSKIDCTSLLAQSGLLARPGLSALLKALSDMRSVAGLEEARIVGGAVRDLVMGRAVGDVDVATTALPDAVMGMAKRQGWKAVPTGIEHGTVTLVVEGMAYEVTTLRRDIETDGRHAVVHFTRDFREDAERRDFTVNALSMSAEGVVHDSVGGVADAKAGRLRFVGDAAQRIKEDYLRILRFYRFLASHGTGDGDADARKACRAMATGLPLLSRERVGQEMRKLLATDRASDVMRLMAADGVLTDTIGPAPHRMDALQQMIALESAFEAKPDWVRRLAAISTDATLPERLRLSRLEANRLSSMRTQSALFADVTLAQAPFATASLATSSEIALSSLLLRLAIAPIAQTTMRQWQGAILPLRHKRLVSPFRAVDFDALNVPPGPRRGAVLRRADALWIAAGMPASKPQRKALLMQAVAEV